MEPTSKIKILYIATNITDSGGVSRVISLKASYFSQLGHEVHIYSTNDTTATPFYPFHHNIHFHYSKLSDFGIKNIIQYQKEVKKLSWAIKPDVTIVTDNGFKSLLISQSLFPSKKIYELHSSKTQILNHTYSGIKKILFKLLLKTKLNNFHKIILLKEYYKLPFIPADKQICIPNPVSFLPKQKSTRTHKRAIAVGRIAQVKGYERMLPIWKKVIQIHPEYTLDIYGDEMENYSLLPLIHQLGLSQWVKVHPATQNIMQEYLNADFLLHSAYLEPFGMVYTEAMACGLPVVCFSTEANDIVINHYNGLVANTSEEYLQNILSVIENPALAQQLAQNAISFVQNYNIDHLCNLQRLHFS